MGKHLVGTVHAVFSGQTTQENFKKKTGESTGYSNLPEQFGNVVRQIIGGELREGETLFNARNVVMALMEPCCRHRRRACNSWC